MAKNCRSVKQGTSYPRSTFTRVVAVFIYGMSPWKNFMICSTCVAPLNQCNQNQRWFLSLMDQHFWHSLWDHCVPDKRINPAPIFEDIRAQQNREHDALFDDPTPHVDYCCLLSGWHRLRDWNVHSTWENLEPLNDHRSLLQYQCCVWGYRYF